MRNIILLAPPASGKGTQANLIKEKFNLIHMSTGDLLRSASKVDNEFGRKLKEIMSSGSLVSDEIVLELIKTKIIENKESNGFIFDGFPRTVNQAIKLDELMESISLKIDNVFLLEVQFDELLKRITGRRTCSNCGKIYNIYNDEMKPFEIDKCDICHSLLTVRSDDNEDSFKVRYQEYLDKTYPLIEYYKNKNNLITIDSNKSIDEVFMEISSIMGDE